MLFLLIRSFLSQRSPQQVLVVGFLLLIVVGSILLWLPVSSRDGHDISFHDALFTATSAVCVTGLTVVPTGQTFSLFGQIVMMILVQMGGIGFMTMTTWFALALGKRISLKERLIIKESLNQANTEGIVRLIRKVVLYSLVVESAAALLFALRWYSEMGPAKALYYGLFHSVSIFNNAGFDLFGGLGAYVNDVPFNIVSIVLILLGGVGFIVMSDLIDYRRTRRFSLHTKVVLVFSGLLFAFGGFVIFLFEYTNPVTFGQLGDGSKLLSAFFHSASLRSSGTSTVDISSMRQATQFFMIIVMFIGAAPGSTGGGIKITTFAVLLAAVWTLLRGREDVVLFRNRLSKDLVYKAVTFTMVGLALVIVPTMILSVTESGSFLSILFDTVSAYGTVGHSMGVANEDLSGFGKTLLVILMFVGRLGPVTLAYALHNKKQRKTLFRYPEGKIIIG
ncbi:TrkH family potassium uptake protein [Cohnella faecalis]|uniref:Trk family potassium uptake protein n=1 Tax=Cohnella faecalis TaxID=2315694 RepID=A0A398CIE6_9BACL|nr:Trk family potassium uptake protein [Cohnella faecalis]